MKGMYLQIHPRSPLGEMCSESARTELENEACALPAPRKGPYKLRDMTLSPGLPKALNSGIVLGPDYDVRRIP